MSESAPKTANEIKVKKPTALIAGGAGFLGAHLAETLIAQNFHVVAVDNLSTGSKENIKDLLTNPNFTFLEADISSDLNLPDDIKINYCFNLAGLEEFKEDKNFSLDTLLVNSLGTRQLLDLCKNSGAKFILASSADLYSGAISTSSLRYYFGKSPTEEAVLSVHEAKRFAEALAFEYFKKYDLDVRIVRLKDVYGPKMNLYRGDEISDLLQKALVRENLVLYGDGLKILNPTYVSDVIFGLIKAALGDHKGEIFILVNPEKVTVESLAKTIKLVAGPLEIEHKRGKDNLDLPMAHFDLENTREKLGFNPKVTLAEGVSAFIQYYRMRERGEEKALETATVITVEQPVSLTGEEVNSKIVPAKKEKRSNSTWLRLAIFAFSLVLLLVTIVFPIADLSLKSYAAKNSLDEAAKSLEADDSAVAITKATLAENDFHTADTDLQNINWLFKIVGLTARSTNFDHLLWSGQSLSLAIRNLANANKLLVDTLKETSLNKGQIRDRLKQTQDILNSSSDKLDEVELILDRIDWKETPRVISPTQDFMVGETVKLQRSVADLAAAVATILNR